MEMLIYIVLMVIALFIAQIMSYLVFMNVVLTKRFMTSYQKKIARAYEALDESRNEESN